MTPRASSLREIARLLDGEVAGQQVVCPGPGHSPQDRSLSVRLDPRAPGGILVHSFANDPALVCKDHVRDRLGQWYSHDGRAFEHPARREHGDKLSDPDRTDRALALW